MRPQALLRVFAVCLLLIAAWPVMADPPARVGRISYLSGQVNFRADKDDEWTQAALNYPVTSHNGFATGNDSRLEIRVGSAAIRLDEDSEISIPRLDDDLIRVNVKRGVANVTVRSRESRYPIEVLTPAGKVTLNGAGAYRFEADRDNDKMIVTAFRGSASIDAEGSQIAVPEGRELVIERIDPLEYGMRNARHGPFEDWALARDARIDQSRSSRYVSPEIAGYEDLDEYGDWQETSEYGTVWAPRTTIAGWAPYRHGRWAWVDPWGWTWIDYAPWGFAPFHYGRWVYFNGYWGWAPGALAARPVYAPALVAFVGRPGWSVSFSSGVAPAVGWVPLGYYDLYRPAYRCSPAYVRNVNITNINVRNVNVTNVNWSNPPTPDYSLRKFPHAVTVVSQQAFASGKPVINQAAKLAAPVSEPVIGTAPHIPGPVRRAAVSDAPGQQRPAAPSAEPSASPRMHNPPHQAERRIWQAPEPRAKTDGVVNVAPAQAPARPDTQQPSTQQPGRTYALPPAASSPQPSHESRGEHQRSRAANPEDSVDQNRHHPHRNGNVHNAPRIEQPVVAQPIPEAPRPNPQRESFERRPYTHQNAPQQEIRSDAPYKNQAQQPEQSGRQMQGQNPGAGRGAGRMRAE